MVIKPMLVTPWRWFTIGVVCVCLAGVGMAAEQPGIGRLREAGMAAYQKGDYADAKRAFDEAFQLSPLQSLGVWSARARVKLGQWVEADDRYDAVVKSPVTKGEVAEEQRAREDAAREREALRHRMPRLRIRLDGVQTKEVTVQIDGNAVSEEFLISEREKKKGVFSRGKSLQVNPGSHQIVAVSGDQRQEVSVSVEEGQTRDVNLHFANPETIRQRKCVDKCRTDCRENNECYMTCKERCFG
jgi:tetratricopeptide (TPR) repeat protein